jgi:hypothetical protein
VADLSYLAEGLQLADSDLGRHGVSPARLRHKLWQLHGQIVRQFCDKIGAGFVANPAEIFDADGFLAVPYRGDAVHGNDAYGAAVLQHLESRP